MQPHMFQCIPSAYTAFSLHTHNSITMRALMIYSPDRAVHLGPMPNATPRRRRLYADRSQSPIATPSERSEDMRPLQPCLALFLSLLLLAGLAACGPASSDNAPSLESRTSVSAPPLSKQNPSPGNNSLPPPPQAVSPLSLASVNGTGSASGMGTIPGWDKPSSKSSGTPIVESVEDKQLKSIEEKKSAALPVPVSIAKDFESPYARIRLQALDYWATQGTKAPLDPLLEALEDDDEDVRAKAAKIVEEQWGIKQELD